MKDYQTVSQEKRAANAKKIPKEWQLDHKYLDDIHENSDINVLDVPRTCGILTEEEIEITERSDATGLLEKIAKRELKSYDVVLAFCKRAAVAQQLVNCLTEIMFDEALERAKACDAYFADQGKPIGPLHGLPISLKDSFNVKGYQTTIAFVAFASNPAATINSALVEILLAAGAVLYVKTNIPQTMMAADSVNNLFGRTLNPNRLCLTAGGSTGGEGALLKMRGSVLGVGTDIAGSMRIPALCNGIFGFKPSWGRVPFAGKVPPGRLGSPSAVAPVIGPKCHSIRDIEMFMRVVIDSEPWKFDDDVINVPWRRTSPPSATQKLRLGLILEDPKRPLHPPMLRTMKTAAAALEKAGHTIIPLPCPGRIPSLYDTSVLAWKYFLLDPKKTPLTHIAAAAEPFVPSLIKYDELKDWAPSLDELWDMNVERKSVSKAYHDIVVQERLDGWIMPPYQSTAVEHDKYGVAIYTVLANMLDYPAAGIPYLKADKEKDKEYVRAGVTYEPAYNPDAIEGAPSGIQIVGRPMMDEELMHIVSEVYRVLGQLEHP